MLWYKAWLETRARFLTCFATVVIFCTVFVHHALHVVCAESLSCSAGLWDPARQAEVYRLLFINQQFLVFMWILSVVLLGMGGIVREGAIGTAAPTLALPVSRARLQGVRVGMGVLQAIALAVVPWLSVASVSILAGRPILMRQVASYILLLVAGGMVYFAMSILISSLIPGEYTAPAVAFGIVILAAILFDEYLRGLNVWRLVTGDFSVDHTTYLLSRHLPWLGILASLTCALLMFFASILAVQRREF